MQLHHELHQPHQQINLKMSLVNKGKYVNIVQLGLIAWKDMAWRKIANISQHTISFNSLVLITGTVFVFSGEHTLTEDVNQGILFIRKEDTVISDNTWSIVLDYNLLKARSELEPIRTVCNEVLNIVKSNVNIWSEDYEFEYVNINNSVAQYEKDFNDILKLLPTTNRQKRGLINVGGYTLKWLFGVAVSEDVEHLANKVDELRHISGSLVHSRQDQLTVLRDMNSKILLNSKAIKEVMDKLSVSNEQLVTSVNTLHEENIMMHRSLSRHMKITTLLRHLGQAIDEAKLRIVEFRESLELVSTGRVSSTLLPPHDFLNILYHIETIVPHNLKLLIPVNEEDLFLFYKLCNVQALATTEGIRLIVNVPLSSYDRQFETYKVQVIPIYHEHTNHWIKWNVEDDYLLVSKDRQTFTTIKSNVLNQCNLNIFYMCTNAINVYRHMVNNCVLSLFMNSESSYNICSRVISNQENSPFWVQAGNDWIFSVKRNYKVTLNCMKNDEVENSEITLHGAGILKHVSHCDINGIDSKLFSRIKGNINYRRNISTLHIPKNMSLLLPNETETLLLNKNITFATLTKLKKQLLDDKTAISLSKLMNQSTTDFPVMYNTEKDPYYVVIFCLVLSLIVLSMLLFVVYVFYRQMSCCRISRVSKSNNNQTTGGVVTIHVDDGTPLADILEEARGDKDVKCSVKQVLSNH